VSRFIQGFAKNSVSTDDLLDMSQAWAVAPDPSAFLDPLVAYRGRYDNHDHPLWKLGLDTVVSLMLVNPSLHTH
jgi:hypothetical protein